MKSNELVVDGYIVTGIYDFFKIRSGFLQWSLLQRSISLVSDMYLSEQQIGWAVFTFGLFDNYEWGVYERIKWEGERV